MIVVYGISNCDTVKKARQWLDNHSVPYRFHDFRKDGIDTALIKDFLNNIETRTLINKRGLSWRNLSDEQKTLIENNEALELILASPTLIKRPVLKVNDAYHIGFNEKMYAAIEFG